MIARRVRRALLAGVMILAACAPALAQPDAGDAPAIRRWLDVQQLQLALRYRWIASSAGDTEANGIQWQSQVRARLLVDRAARLRVHVGAFTGNGFTSGWDNTGIGTGRPSGAFTVKQLFAELEPVDGLELQAGSLYVNRGETSEILSYDNDAYVMGERMVWRPSAGPLTQVAVTAGYVGDFELPNVFRRFRHMDQWNYAQVLIGARPLPSVDVSADYTREGGLDTLREGVHVRLPGGTRLLRALRAEAYQRVSTGHGAGFNVAADLELAGRLRVTGGVEHVDGGAGARPVGPLNGDRFETGARAYDMGTIGLTEVLTVGWFHDIALRTRDLRDHGHRFEILATINPTMRLRRARVF